MHRRASLFLALLALAASARAQSSTPVSRFYPFQTGARWTYRFQQSIAGVVPHVNKVIGSWSDTVSAVEAVAPQLQIITITRNGTFPQDFGPCPGPSSHLATVQFWYVLQPTRVFVRCTEADAQSLAATLAASPAAAISADDGPDYVLPFRVGAFWADDPAVKRDDDMYRWNVVATGTVTVPAGRFSGCFETSYETNPDDEERWLCPGVGLVEQDYDHHGTTNEITIKLTRFQRGSPQTR